MQTESKTTKPQPIDLIAKMRLMADGGKEIGANYDWEELMRLGANEIERLYNMYVSLEHD